MREQGTPGLSVAITGRDERSASSRSATQIWMRDPVTAGTLFAIGSITKSMTALALLQLHDAGSLT